MKVKITYTVDLEDVPAKTDPILESAVAAMKEVSKRVSALKELKDSSIEKSLKEISDIRTILMDVDFALDDCDAMLTGYLKAITDSPSYPAVQEAPEDD